ncbi:MAG: hypothetical protein RJA49_2274 [Actinomycetota bacterium]|jgi:hypothetical protein
MKLSKTLVACGLVLGSTSWVSGTVSAHSSESTRVRVQLNVAGTNFTDCPIVPAEMTCLGAAVRAEAVRSEVGDMESRTRTVSVTVVEVHLHADGTFEIGAVVNSGSGPGRVKAEGVRSARVKAAVPMSDGSTAMVQFRLKGTGPSTPFSGMATEPQPGCASGSADVSFKGKSRDATATGQLTIGTDVQVPTDAAGPAFLQSERDRGVCTTM